MRDAVFVSDHLVTICRRRPLLVLVDVGQQRLCFLLVLQDLSGVQLVLLVDLAFESLLPPHVL